MIRLLLNFSLFIDYFRNGITLHSHDAIVAGDPVAKPGQALIAIDCDLMMCEGVEQEPE